MANESANLDILSIDSINDLDFDDLESKLQSNLDEQLSDLEFLKEDREKIGNPETLGSTVMNIVWEQFLNQMANTAGEDFIRENRGLTLDLRNDSHIQTTENFEKGKIATHNNNIDYQKRHDDWKSNFQKDENGNVKRQYDNRSMTEKAVLTKEARTPFDKTRDQGSASVHKDHTVSAAEIIRDPHANAHLSKEEQIVFANSDTNLKDLDSSANTSKGDSTMTEWLNSERNGEKPAERFNIDEEKLREDDKVAREEYDKLKKEGEQKSKEAGKKSQKEEAFKITGKALRTLIMQLLSELIKEVIRKLITWLMSVKRSTELLLESIKSALSSFVKKLKNHLISAGTSVVSTITTAIFGPVVRTINKAFTMLKQGWASLKEAISYLKNPENKTKPIGFLILEVGKIVIAGLSAVGALVLGEVIEKSLMTIPFLAFDIPIIGSLASILGLLLGGLVSGIIGALAISLIDKIITKKKKGLAIEKEITQGNEVLNTQNLILVLNEIKLERTKDNVSNTISKRHSETAALVNDTLIDILQDDIKVINTGNEADYDRLLQKLNELSD